MDVRNSNIKTISKVAFYEPPARKTSAEIINEARLAIQGKYMFSNGNIQVMRSYPFFRITNG